MSNIQDENYVNLQGWMINRLNLKGNELTIFAVIYGFTQDGENWFEGSRAYLANWCNSTKKGITKNLQSLVDKGLLIKKDIIVNKVKFCKYRVNLEAIKRERASQYREQSSIGVGNKVPQGREQSSPGVGNKVPQGREQSSPNNIDNNIDINNIDNNIRSKKVFEQETFEKEFEEVWKEYPNKKGKPKAKASYIKARKSGETKENILSGLKKYKQEIEHRKIETQFIKNGDTWFRNECWNDEYETRPATKTNTNSGVISSFDFEEDLKAKINRY